MSACSICLDEIALEGLDGITISALWIRLADCIPAFPMKLDDATKAYLWREIALLDDLQFYELEAPRPPLVLKKKYLDCESQIVDREDEEETIEDIYPICIIEDKNIRGSCSTYHTRKDVTSYIRNDHGELLCNLDNVIERWGGRLVIVASQELREESIFEKTANTNFPMVLEHYCFLERVARSRFVGELTQGKNSISVAMKRKSKDIFYMKKILSKCGLCKSQHFSKSTGFKTMSGNLIHIPRFYSDQSVKWIRQVRLLCDLLDAKPNKREVMQIIRAETQLKDKTFKKTTDQARLMVTKTMIPFREMYPDADEKTWRLPKKNNQIRERQVQVLTLIKPFDMELLRYNKDDTVEPDEEAEDENDIEAYDLQMELPTICQIYKFIKDVGLQGRRITDINCALQIGRLNSRSFVRNLEKNRLISSVLINEGKQRTCRYIAMEFLAPGSLHARFAVEEALTKALKKKSTKLAIKPEVKDEPPVPVELPALDVSQDSESMQVSIDAVQEESTPPPTVEPKDEEATISVKHTVIDGIPLNTNLPEELSELSESLINRLSFEYVNKYNRSKGKGKDSHVTFRTLKRANYILKKVEEMSIVTNIFSLIRGIRIYEKEEGYDTRMDKRSLSRLLERLSQEGALKLLKTTVRYEGQEKSFIIVCHAKLSSDDPLIQRNAREAKLQMFSSVKMVDRSQCTGQKTPMSHWRLKMHQKHLKNKSLEEVKKSITYNAEFKRIYGFEPIYKRLEIVHTLLWYLAYDWKTDHIQTDPEDFDPEKYITPDGTEPHVYKDELTWKRFIPPQSISVHGEGWCIMSDIILSLPLCLFVKIISINYEVEGLAELLKHPTDRFLLIGQIPEKVSVQLLFTRKYIHAFHEMCEYLCMMGLLSFGPRIMNEKDRTFLYVHKSITIVDTTPLESKYTILDKGVVENGNLDHFLYRFRKETDVTNFWLDLKIISLNTSFTVHAPPDIDTELYWMNGHRSKKALPPFTDLLKNKAPHMVEDKGIVPGDKRGPGGFDGGLHLQMQRKWGTFNLAPVLPGNRVFYGQKEVTALKAPQHKTVGRLPRAIKNQTLDLICEEDKHVKVSKEKPADGAEKEKESQAAKIKNLKTRVTTKSPVKGGKGIPKRKRKTSTSAGPVKKKRKLQIKHLYPKGKISNLLYDQKDVEAMGRMEKQRVNWTEREDSLLLICKVASLFMVGERPGLIVPWTTVRDTMHDAMPESADKSTKTCIRRVAYMMKNEQTKSSVATFLSECLCDKELVGRFKTGKVYKLTNIAYNVKVFKQLLECLLLKFKKHDERSSMLDLPDDIETCYKKFTFSVGSLKFKSTHSDVTSPADVHISVIHNFIHSVAAANDKVGRAQVLYKVFSSYSEDTLQTTFYQMVKDGIIVKKRRDYNQGRSQHSIFVKGTHQLAQRYIYSFIFKYHHEIFKKSDELFSTLRNQTLIKSELGDDGEAKGYEVSRTDEGGYTALIIGLQGLGKLNFHIEIPENIIAVENIPGVPSPEATEKHKKDGGIRKKADNGKTEGDKMNEGDEEVEGDKREKTGEIEEIVRKQPETVHMRHEGAQELVSMEHGYFSGSAPKDPIHMSVDEHLDDVEWPERNHEVEEYIKNMGMMMQAPRHNHNICKTTVVQENSPIERLPSGLNQSTTPVPVLTQRTTSRFITQMNRQQSNFMECIKNIQYREIGCNENLVISSCRTHVKILANENQEGGVTEQRDTNDSAYIHPKFSREILKRVTRLHNHNVTFKSFLEKPEIKSNFTSTDMEEFKRIHDDVESQGYLGYKEIELWERFGEISNFKQLLDALLESQV
ncbi:unnamed protein product, partial [Owenia fusiformis]